MLAVLGGEIHLNSLKIYGINNTKIICEETVFSLPSQSYSREKPWIPKHEISNFFEENKASLPSPQSLGLLFLVIISQV